MFLSLSCPFLSFFALTHFFRIPLKLREAEDARDALAKALYNAMFLKLVKRVNESIGYREDIKLFCGVLDIFGFECFQSNSLEQLCINYTNERLQQFFNTFIFNCEEELYIKEGIAWSALDFPDNADCVSLIDQRVSGILAILNEECVVPRGTDQGFCNKVKAKHKDNRRFGMVKTQANRFIVHHFAGAVSYCTDGFLDKNRDLLSKDIQECLVASESVFISSLFG